MNNDFLSKLYKEAKDKYESYKVKENEVTVPDNISFDEPPSCIKQILQNGVMELGTKNMIQYRLAAYFKSQKVNAQDCVELMDEWAMNIRREYTHEITHDGRVDYDEIKKQNRYIISTVYGSNSYGFSCSGIRQVPGVVCDPGCKIKVEGGVLVTLFDSDKVQYRYKRISIEVEVVGRKDIVAIVPATIHAICTGMMDSSKCGACALKNARDGVNFRITSATPGLLNLIESSNVPLAGKIAKMIGLTRRECSSWSWKHTEQNLETIFVSPRLTNDVSASDRYTKKKVYYMGHGIETNRAYLMSGYTHVSDKDGDIILVFDKAEELSDSLSEFKWTTDMAIQSKIFQPDPRYRIKEKFDDITKALNKSITKMWGRENMLKGIDLAFHSVRRIPFQGAIIKGWLDILIIGDSGQGKTTMFERLMDHYKAGYIASGNSSTRAGLLYGVDVKTEGPPTLIWGVFPRNTGRLVMLDEAKNLIDEGGFADLTRARSQGVVEVNTIVSGKATSETRLIIVTNPSERRMMNSFMFPVESIPYLIPTYADIRRFDFAIGVMSNEVTDEEIHKDVLSLAREDLIYTSEKCSNLLYWVWNLKPEDIVYPHKVQKRTLALSLQLCKEYSSEIPLVEPADERETLARISVAMAARMYQSDGKKLEVTKECVDAAYDFLNDIYRSPALDYHSFSLANAKMFISDEDMDRLVKEFKNMYPTYWKPVANFIMYNNFIKPNILAASTGMELVQVRGMLNWFESLFLTKNSKFGIYCSTNGIRFFRTLSPLEDKTHLDSYEVVDMEEEF